MYAPLQNVITRNMSLEELNVEEVKTLIPTIIYTSLLMVCGVIGNALVLYVYCFRFKASNHRYFILTLGICDFITSAVCMPFLIADELLPFMFTNTIVCKSLRYITYNTAIVSIFTLFVIGVERHKKICQPLDKQITLPLARRILFGIVLLTCTIFALPAFILYGNTSIYTGYRNVTGVACFIDDRFRDTHIPVAYNTALFTIVFVLGSAMVYCYSRIAHQRLIRAKLKNARKRYCKVENSENYFSSDRSGNDVHTSTLNGLMEEFNETIKEQSTQTHNSVVQKLSTLNEHNNHVYLPSTEISDRHFLELNQTSNELSEEHNIGTIRLGNKANNRQNGMYGSKTNHINKFKNTSTGDNLCTVIHRNRKHNLHVNGNVLRFDLASRIPADDNAKTGNDSNTSISVPPAALTGYDNQLDISLKCIEHDPSTVYDHIVNKNDIDYMSKSDQNLFLLWRSQTESSGTKEGLKILSDSCLAGKGFHDIKKKRTCNFSDTLVHRNIDNIIYDKKHAVSCDNFDLVFKEADQHDKMLVHETTYTTEDIPKHINQKRKESSPPADKICSKHSSFDRESDFVSDLPQEGPVADSQHNLKPTTISATNRNQMKCRTNGIFEEKGADTLLLNGNISKLKNSKIHLRCRKAFVKRNETKSAKYAQKRDMSLIRVTKMLFVITLVYFISFIPHLVLMIVLMLDDQFLLSLDQLNAAVYYIALRSFLINSVANPFIYNFMDIKFRKECQKLCRRNK